jgi:Uma2 family endonuclease
MIAQVIDGELHLQPRPAKPHTRAGSRLGITLGGPFDIGGHNQPGGWVILVEPELHLGRRPDILVPDLAGWRRERMPDAIGSEDDASFYTLAPDWICEVLSPKTARTDRVKKMRIYRREGVTHVWLVDPTEQTLEAYGLESGRYVQLDVHEGDEKVRAEPFEVFELDLALLWAR